MRRTVVGLGGDEDGGDKQAVDVVVRRAERGPVLLAEPPEISQGDQETQRVKLRVAADADEIAMDRHRRLRDRVEYRRALRPQVRVLVTQLLQHR